jgi:hypothetical protein
MLDDGEKENWTLGKRLKTRKVLHAFVSSTFYHHHQGYWSRAAAISVQFTSSSLASSFDCPSQSSPDALAGVPDCESAAAPL